MVKILKMIRVHPNITIAELSDITNVTTRSVERNIESLKKAGKIERKGEGRKAHREQGLGLLARTCRL